MRWSDEVEAGQWIRERLSPDWGTVGSVAPTGFEAYARILHPVPASRWAPAPEASTRAHHATVPRGPGQLIEETSWSWAQAAARTGTRVHPRVQWRQVAGTAYETVSVGEGWELDTPCTGRLAPELLARLMALTHPATTTPNRLFIGVWEGWGELHPSSSSTVAMASTEATPEELEQVQARILAQEAAAVDPQVARVLAEGPLLELPWRSYVLLQATAQELTDPAWPHRAGIGSIEGLQGPMPQLIWPTDRAWCVASEIDWDSTIVGGTLELITAIIQDSVLEAVPMEPVDDLSWNGDDLNEPH